MTWAPQYKVADVTEVVDNLITYFEANQSDALEWAGVEDGGFARFYPNAPGRLISKFPSLVFLDQRYETDLSGDALLVGLELRMEGCVTGGNLDTLTLTTKRYAMAMESMLANVPSATLTDSGHATLFEIETGYDLAGQLKNANSFLAIFGIRCLYKIVASAY